MVSSQHERYAGGAATAPEPAGPERATAATGGSDRTRPMRNWDRVWERVLVLVPWVLLAPPTLISQLPPDQTAGDRMATLGLVGLAAGWVYVGHTRAPDRWRGRPVPTVVYFLGLLVLFTLLMAQHQGFVLFTIVGFFHAYCLKPWPLGVAGVFGTSVVLNTMTQGFPDATAEAIGAYVGIIAIQTAAIGAGVVLSEKGMEYSRQREQLVEKLEAALAENAGLHAQLLAQAREAGVLDERQRMAREIHDTLAQGLTGIITQVQAAQRMWDSPGTARPHLDRALGLARDSLAEARRSVQALRPRELEEAQLPDALRDLAQRWAQHAGIDLQVEITGEQAALSPAIEVALFRMGQEALTNVAKHAGATRVGVTLSYLGDVVLLDVRDDGKGMAQPTGRGFGLTSMTQRIRTVGGSVEIESVPGEGTTVSASVPASAGGAR